MKLILYTTLTLLGLYAFGLTLAQIVIQLNRYAVGN